MYKKKSFKMSNKYASLQVQASDRRELCSCQVRVWRYVEERFGELLQGSFILLARS